jgi:small subunit ribosomal protein S1
MPVSQIELFHVEEPASYLNQRLRCQVIDLDRSQRNVVVSRRAVLEVEAAQAREHLLESLQEGKILTGTVKTVMPYGAFVDIGGVDGLLHVSDISYARTDDPSAVLQPGQQVEVMVLKVDRDSRRISLGLKQIKPDPWADAESRWPVDDVVTGRVTRLAEFGAFVELTEGVEGLIPIGELTFERRIRHPEEIVSANEVVRVRVLNVDVARRRIGLSLKRAGDDPWIGASVRWPADSVVTGTVKRITDFGAFVELVPGVEGLVHISEMSENRVRAVSDVLSVGQQVEAKVLTVEEERRRIALSIKQRVTMADYTGPAHQEPEPSRPQPKRKKPLRGGLDF